MSDQNEVSQYPNGFTAVENRTANIVYSLVLVAATAATFLFVGNKQGLLFIIGGALGLVLYQASFGFTAGFSQTIKSYKTRQLRAQMLMLMVASFLMLPLLAQGEFMGNSVSGKLTPISIALISGAFIFGVGMQLGGGCASGTLSHLGSGSLRMGVTLAGFILGSLIGTFHVPWWNEFPSLGRYSMIDDWGLTTAIVVNLSIAAGLWFLFVIFEKKIHGHSDPLYTKPTDKKEGFLANNWPLVLGAVLLAVLNLATLMVKGKPWGVTSGFALWGGKIYAMMGGDLSGYAYWQTASWSKALAAPVLKHSTSIMNFGLVLGVWWAASVSRKMTVTYRASALLILRLILGGLLLGYGARLAAGCNIGAYFSGIASGSLHGWVWFVAAFVGNIFGYQLKNTVFLKAEVSG